MTAQDRPGAAFDSEGPEAQPEPERAPAAQGSSQKLGPCVILHGHGTLTGDNPEVERLAVQLKRELGQGARIVKPAPLDDKMGRREAASAFFTPMAAAISGGYPLVMLGSWLNYPGIDRRIGIGRRRMLERAALTLGAKVWILGRQFETPLGCLPAGWMAEHDAHRFVVDMLPMRHENLGPGGGAWRPGKSILLIGDRPNSAKHGTLKHRLPFVSLVEKGCSVWLADQLELTGWSESWFYWINAYDCEGKATDSSFVERLRPRAVIALGEEAKSWCIDAKLKGALAVRHPSYWKRFQAGERYGLVRAVKHALLAEEAK